MAQAEQPAAPVPLCDLRSLVFGHRPLDLHQQPCARIIQGRLFDEDHLHAEALQLLQDQHLIRVIAREAVWAEHQDGRERTGACSVPQGVQRRPVQPRPAEAIVEEACHIRQFIAVVCGIPLQDLHLRRDRPLLLLPTR